MEAEFWINKWESNQIGFHEDHYHPMLLKHWAKLDLAIGARVFAPLCGKSKDLLWLADLGHHVMGIELSEIAVSAFFDENDIEVSRSDNNGLVCYRSDSYTLFCGDYFTLSSTQLGSVDAVYDRAALIALPPAMRERYVGHLRTLLRMA